MNFQTRFFLLKLKRDWKSSGRIVRYRFILSPPPPRLFCLIKRPDYRQSSLEELGGLILRGYLWVVQVYVYINKFTCPDIYNNRFYYNAKNAFMKRMQEGESNSIMSNLSRTEIQISWDLSICIYIIFSTYENLTFSFLWSNIILSSFSQRCLLLPLPEYYSLLVSLDFFSLSGGFLFFDILMLLLFFITATRFSFSFSIRSRTLVLPYRFYRRNYLFF